MLEQRRSHLGLQVRAEDFTDQEAISAIIKSAREDPPPFRGRDESVVPFFGAWEVGLAP